MKIKKVNKKLMLNKTTVSNLDNRQMVIVKAGEEETAAGIFTCDSCLVCPTDVGATCISCNTCDFSCPGYPCITDNCTVNCTVTCNESKDLRCP